MRAGATRTDQWSGWEMSPEIGPWPGPGDTAGANGSGNDGFDIDRRGVRAVSGKLIQLALDGLEKPLYTYSQLTVGFPWRLPHDIARHLYKAGQSAVHYWEDLNAEIGTAGALIERSCTRYDLVDNPRPGDMPSMEASPGGKWPPGRLGERPIHWSGPHSFYPNGTHELPSLAGDGIGVDHQTAAGTVGAFHRPSTDYEEGIPTFLDSLGSSLVELANTLPLRAQDLYDAPWRGQAADLMQRALRQVYDEIVHLATLADTLDAACKRFLEVVDWYRMNFYAMADPHRPFGHELPAIGTTNFYDPHRPNLVEPLTTADSRTRDFLRTAESLFLEVANMLPPPITPNLPGLMVADEDLKELRASIEDDRKYGTWYERQDLVENEELLQGMEAAERTYG